MMLNIKCYNFNNELITSKVISIIIVISLILTPFIVFADDSTADMVQGSAVELTAEENEFISNASDDTDLIIRQAVVQAVRAASSGITLDNLYDLLFMCITNIHGRYEWCVTDQALYNLLNNNFSHYDPNSGNTYDTGAMLWYVLTHVENIANEIVPALSSAPTLYSIQSQILSALNNLNAELIPASASADTLYEITADLNDTLNAFFLAFQSFASSQINYTSALYYNNIGVAQYAYQTNQTTANVFTMLNNVLRPLINNIDTNISYLKSNSDTLVSTTNTISNTLTSVQSDINNISWLQLDCNYLGYSVNNLNTPIQNNSTVTIQSNQDLYLYYSANFSNSIIKLFKLSIPIWTYTDIYNDNLIKSLNILDANGNIYSGKYYIDYDSQYRYLQIYIYDFSPSNSNFTIKIIHTPSLRLGKFDNSNYTVFYIPYTNQDFYTVYSYLVEKRTLETYDLWKYLYASDDIIASKKAQQPLEDNILNDFTGSGSASASVSDAIDIKGVQSSVKGSLDTGNVSASGLATVLNTSNPNSNNSFFSFWTSSVADDINGVQNILQTRDTIYVHIDDSSDFDNLVRGQSW